MNGRLLITCPDRHGIVAAVAGFLAGSGANIITSDQHSTDPEGGEFFMRMEFTLERGDLELARARVRAGGRRAARHALAARPTPARPKRDGDPRARGGPLPASTCCGATAAASSTPRSRSSPPTIPTTAADVEGFGIPYTTCRSRGQRADELLELLRGRVDLVVLARYMRILSGEFLDGAGRAGDQHPPLVPAGVRRREPVPARVRARREDHRRDRALRDRGARRRPDHRAGRRARVAPRARRDDGPPRARHRAHRARARREVAPRGPGAGARQPDRRRSSRRRPARRAGPSAAATGATRRAARRGGGSAARRRGGARAARSAIGRQSSSISVAGSPSTSARARGAPPTAAGGSRGRAPGRR